MEMKKAMEAAVDAQRAAVEDAKRAAKEAGVAAKEATEAAKGEASKAWVKAWSIPAEPVAPAKAPAIRIERRTAPTPTPAPTPAPAKAPQALKEIRIETAPFRESADMAIVPKEELKRLLKLAESLEEQTELGELKSGSVGEAVKNLTSRTARR